MQSGEFPKLFLRWAVEFTQIVYFFAHFACDRGQVAQHLIFSPSFRIFKDGASDSRKIKPAGLESRILAQVEFKTVVGREHPLARKRSVDIQELLKEPFVIPESPILGRIAKSSSTDGWRDDKFPRNIKYRASGLKLIESLVREGRALAYLPEHLAAAQDFVPLKITGCPYTCRQTVRVIAKDPSELGWLSRLWERL